MILKYHNKYLFNNLINTNSISIILLLNKIILFIIKNITIHSLSNDKNKISFNQFIQFKYYSLSIYSLLFISYLTINKSYILILIIFYLQLIS